MLLEATSRKVSDTMAEVEVELKSGSTVLGLVPVSELIPVGDIRVLFRVNILDEDPDEGPASGPYALVEPCYDVRWKLRPDFMEGGRFEDGLRVYKADLAPDLPADTIPRQRQAEMASL